MSKPQKKKAAPSSSSSDSDSGPEDVCFICVNHFIHNKIKIFVYFSLQRTPAKKAKESAKVAEDADPTWDLDKNKRVKVREFKGRTSVDIREYYLKDGNLLPGKKGISLQPAQWRKLVEIAGEITKELDSK